MWDSEKKRWFFSVVDVVEVLTESDNKTDAAKVKGQRRLPYHLPPPRPKRGFFITILTFYQAYAIM